MLNKRNLEEDELQKVNDIFNLYVEHGFKYNEKINLLYMDELKDMIKERNGDVIPRENIIISSNFTEDGGTEIVI